MMVRRIGNVILMLIELDHEKTGPKVIQLFYAKAQLSIKIFLLLNVKMPAFQQLYQ